MKKQPDRKEYFKLLACDSHSWPTLECENCFDKLMEVAEKDFEQIYERATSGRSC